MTSEKRYVLPEEGLKAACLGMAEIPLSVSSERGVGLRKAIEAFIRWQSENPRVPTYSECREMFEKCQREFWRKTEYREEGAITREVVIEWQRQMYLAPDQEVPEEIKDLMWEPGLVRRTLTDEEFRNAIIEAYRRGQKAG